MGALQVAGAEGDLARVAGEGVGGLHRGRGGCLGGHVGGGVWWTVRVVGRSAEPQTGLWKFRVGLVGKSRAAATAGAEILKRGSGRLASGAGWVARCEGALSSGLSVCVWLLDWWAAGGCQRLPVR